MLYLDGGSRQFADVEVKRISGSRGLGFHLLRVEIELRVEAFEGDDADMPILTDLSGRLNVEGINKGGKYLGIITPGKQPVHVMGYRSSRNTFVEMVIELDAQRMEALENLRQGHHLNFSGEISGRVLWRSKYHTVFDKLYHNIPQGLWVEVLGQLGYSRVKLLEVPEPDKNATPELHDAFSCLEKANIELANGNWREAVGHCRDVLESLSVAKGDGDHTDPAFDAIFANTRQMGKEERQIVIRRSLKTLAHPAKHRDEDAQKIEWRRDDAVGMVTIMAAVLNWMGSD